MSERKTETVVTQVISVELGSGGKGPAGRAKLSYNGKFHGVWDPVKLKGLHTGMWIKAQVSVSADGRYYNLEDYEETEEPAVGSPERAVATVTAAAGTYETAEEREARLRMQAMQAAQQAAAWALAGTIDSSGALDELRRWSQALYQDILAARRGESSPIPAVGAGLKPAQCPKISDESHDPKGPVTDWLVAYKGAATTQDINRIGRELPASLRNHPQLAAARDAAVKRITGK